MKRYKRLRHIKSVRITTDSLHLSSLFVLGFLVLILLFREPLHQAPTILTRTPVRESEATSTIFNPSAFDNIQLNAKAYIVYDVVEKHVIASGHASERLPLASITKVMTTLTARSLYKDQNDVVKITPSTIEDGYDLGLTKNQSWKLDELLKYMLVFSSNDAALSIASHYGGKDQFIATMNSLAAKYGLTATFTDPAGRDADGKIGGLGTVLDAAQLFILAKTTAPEVLDATTKKRQNVTSLTGRLTGVPNTNQDIQNLPGAEGSKTGYTDLAGGNLGVVVDITVGRPVVIVVLGSTREGRFRDVEVLYKALEKSLEPFPIKKGE